MVHLTQRLQERGIQMSPSDLQRVASGCNRDTAVILCQCGERRVMDGYLGSNGDMVILIVRGCRPVTIMFRRSNQPMTACALRVDEVINLVN